MSIKEKQLHQLRELTVMEVITNKSIERAINGLGNFTSQLPAWFCKELAGTYQNLYDLGLSKFNPDSKSKYESIETPAEANPAQLLGKESIRLSHFGKNIGFRLLNYQY
jgi:hypothetical protein